MIANMSKTVYVILLSVQAHVTIATQLLQLHMHFVHEDWYCIAGNIGGVKIWRKQQSFELAMFNIGGKHPDRQIKTPLDKLVKGT